MKFSISGKLRMGFLALGVLFIVSSLLVYRSVIQVQDHTQSLLQYDLPTVDASRQVGQSLQSTVSVLRGYMLLNDSDNGQSFGQERVLEAFDTTDIQLISLESLISSNQYHDLDSAWSNIKLTAEEIVTLSHTDDNLPAHSMFINEAAPIAEVALDQLQGLINDEAGRTEGGERKRLFKLYADGYTSLANALAALRDYLQYGQQDYLDKYHDLMKYHRQVVDEISSKTSLLSSSDQSLWSLFNEMKQLYFPLAEQVIQIRQSADWNRASYLMSSSLVPAVDAMQISLNTIVSQQQANAVKTEDSITTSITTVVIILMTSCGAALLSAFVVSSVMGHHIGARIKTLANRAQQIASGDVSNPALVITGSDELADLTRSVNSMNQSLADLVGGVTENAVSVQGGMAQLMQSSRDGLQRMERQSQHVDEIGHSLSEVAVGAEQTAHQVQASSSTLFDSKAELQSGEVALKANQESMTLLAEAIETTAALVETLRQESQAISKVTDVIEGLAEQTNLLALNAAIEAARAGEQGRGFAVVADEVRMLASRTTESTSEINGIIQAIQSSTEKVVEQIGIGNTIAGEAVSHTNMAASRIKSTAEQVENVNDQMSTLAATAEQQASATQSISTLVNEINEALKMVAQQSRDANSVTDEVTARVEQLSGQVAQFKCG
ncbi:methyl-accepting chemotaxis protein [Vibrio cionasavignyae]|uniref:methyl-accepting chemotaxis protein n=1 Tax=Vibrio cionasavignyae TaxID=2910252 RepID=UPI003D09B030